MNYQLIQVIAMVVIISACAPKPPKVSDAHIREPVKPSGQIPDLAEPSYLPPKPTYQPSEEVYTIVVKEVPLNELLFALARDADVNIDIAPGITGKITLNAIDQTLSQILARISTQAPIRYHIENKIVTIEQDNPYYVHYKIDYAHLDRDNNSNISISTQIETTGRGASTGGSGTGSSSSSSSSGGVGNNSSTIIDTHAQNKFWKTLVQNITAILRGGDSTQSVQGQQQNQTSETTSSNDEQQNKSLTELEEQKKQEKLQKDIRIIANPESGTISIKATQKQQHQVQKFIDTVMEGALRQVLIEATIVEVKLNDDYQGGVDWQWVLKNGLETLQLSQGMIGSNLATAPAFALGFNKSTDNYDLSSTVKLLSEFGDAKVLSSPKLMVLNNQTAMLKVVDNRVYFTIDVQLDVPLNGPVIRTFTSRVHSVPIGLVMSVTPQISDSSEVILNVRPTISRILKFVEDPNPALRDNNGDGTVKNLIPEISVREMESILKVNDGNIAIIGGLMTDNQKNATSGLPILSKIPGIGDLFSYKNNANSKSELVIFIRPIVMKNASLQGDLKDYRKFLPHQLPKPETGIFQP